MKHLLLTIAFLITSIISFAQVRVSGYYRKNGTYVQPHMRSSPDGNPYNNYSYPGNTNPYTGKVATGNPDTYLKNYYNKNSSTSSGSSSTGGYVSTYTSPSTYTPSTSTYSAPITNDFSSKLESYEERKSRLESERKTENFLNQVEKYTRPKLYLKNASGKKIGYLQSSYEGELVKEYDIYNLGGKLTGYISYFNNGIVYQYDTNRRLIKQFKIK